MEKNYGVQNAGGSFAVLSRGFRTGHTERLIRRGRSRPRAFWRGSIAGRANSKWAALRGFSSPKPVRCIVGRAADGGETSRQGGQVLRDLLLLRGPWCSR